MTKINVTVRSVYGTPRYYPECLLSKVIAKISGKKTIDLDDLDLLRTGGLSVIVTDEAGEAMEYPATN